MEDDQRIEMDLRLDEKFHRKQNDRNSQNSYSSMDFLCVAYLDILKNSRNLLFLGVKVGICVTSSILFIAFLACFLVYLSRLGK